MEVEQNGADRVTWWILGALGAAAFSLVAVLYGDLHAELVDLRRTASENARNASLSLAGTEANRREMTAWISAHDDVHAQIERRLNRLEDARWPRGSAPAPPGAIPQSLAKEGIAP